MTTLAEIRLHWATATRCSGCGQLCLLLVWKDDLIVLRAADALVPLTNKAATDRCPAFAVRRYIRRGAHGITAVPAGVILNGIPASFMSSSPIARPPESGLPVVKWR